MATESGGLRALIGIALVVRFPFEKQEEVVFHHEHPEEEEQHQQHQQKHQQQDKDKGAGGDKDVTSAAAAAADTKDGRKAAAHAIRDDGECFGLPKGLFASWNLPSHKLLLNTPLYVKLDSGQLQTPSLTKRPENGQHGHGRFGHLIFASFPCDVRNFLQERERAGDSEAQDDWRVQQFNIVFVLNSMHTSFTDPRTSKLWQCSAHLARALVVQEDLSEYLTQHVGVLRRGRTCSDVLPTSPAVSSSTSPAGAGPPVKEREASNNSEAVAGQESEQPPLAKLLMRMFLDLRSRGSSSLLMDGVLIDPCTFPTKQAPDPPTEDQALVILVAKDQLRRELRADCASLIRELLEQAGPQVSLARIVLNTGYSLSALQRASQHLVYHRMAKVVDVFQPDTLVTLATKARKQLPELKSKYDNWRKAKFDTVFKKHKPQNLSLSEVLVAFSEGKTLHQAEMFLNAEFFGRRGIKEAFFDLLLEWLVAEGVIVQIATFYQYLCHRRRSMEEEAPHEGLLRSHSQKDFNDLLVKKKITLDELMPLAVRLDTRMELHLVVDFVMAFVKKRQRVDGPYFNRFVDQHFARDGREIFDGILSKCSDVLIRYRCRIE